MQRIAVDVEHTGSIDTTPDIEAMTEDQLRAFIAYQEAMGVKPSAD